MTKRSMHNSMAKLTTTFHGLIRPLHHCPSTPDSEVVMSHTRQLLSSIYPALYTSSSLYAD